MPKKSDTADQRPSRLLTLDQAATELAISRRTAYDKMLMGEIRGVDVGNGDKPSWRITRESVEQYLSRIIAESEARFGQAS